LIRQSLQQFNQCSNESLSPRHSIHPATVRVALANGPRVDTVLMETRYAALTLDTKLNLHFVRTRRRVVAKHDLDLDLAGAQSSIASGGCVSVRLISGREWLLIGRMRGSSAS
jgi:hypothetical protein